MGNYLQTEGRHTWIHIWRNIKTHRMNFNVTWSSPESQDMSPYRTCWRFTILVSLQRMEHYHQRVHPDLWPGPWHARQSVHVTQDMARFLMMCTQDQVSPWDYFKNGYLSWSSLQQKPGMRTSFRTYRTEERHKTLPHNKTNKTGRGHGDRLTSRRLDKHHDSRSIVARIQHYMNQLGIDSTWLMILNQSI